MRRVEECDLNAFRRRSTQLWAPVVRMARAVTNRAPPPNSLMRRLGAGLSSGQVPEIGEAESGPAVPAQTHRHERRCHNTGCRAIDSPWTGVDLPLKAGPVVKVYGLRVNAGTLQELCVGRRLVRIRYTQRRSAGVKEGTTSSRTGSLSAELMAMGTLLRLWKGRNSAGRVEVALQRGLDAAGFRATAQGAAYSTSSE